MRIFYILPVLFCMHWSACMDTNNQQNRSIGDEYSIKRLQMVEQQIKSRGIQDPRVLRAMMHVPRHRFVIEQSLPHAYADTPLTIGYEQTISQPYIVAYMTEALELTGVEKVLEVGTGSGYQAAVLCELAENVFSIEIVEPLCLKAKQILESEGYTNFHGRCGDGYAGWPEEAPFDAIIVTAAPPYIPKPLLEQLKPGGRMIIPVGNTFQKLVRIIRKADGSFDRQDLIPVRFVPMTGRIDSM